ncbi:hypothetical protein RIF29_29906 [Crotalaria pallida]|uniref:Uncharacterized protein n=1 Tax=Crotalaria pallida TaxID=3830 RepID=A0AAN9EHQ4_CROPI
MSGEFSDITEPIKAPGCVPIMAQDLPGAFQNRSSEIYKQFLDLGKGMYSANGILVNCFFEMESSVISALAEEGIGKPGIYPVGPITRKETRSEDNGSECLRWLDKQQPSSVLYISFGSGGTLPYNQVNELALGLELSGQKFLWVFRAPSNSASDGYLGVANEDTLQYLPSGFLERTKVQGEEGKVMRKRMKDLQVVAHSALHEYGSSTKTLSLLASKWENFGGI